MKLGMEVGLGSGHIASDGEPAPAPRRRKAHPQFSAHVCCGQTVGWIEMKLGTEVGLGPGHIVLDGDQTLLPKQHSFPQFSAYVRCGIAPTFRPMCIVAKRLDGSRCHLVRR